MGLEFLVINWKRYLNENNKSDDTVVSIDAETEGTEKRMNLVGDGVTVSSMCTPDIITKGVTCTFLRNGAISNATHVTTCVAFYRTYTKL